MTSRSGKSVVVFVALVAVVLLVGGLSLWLSNDHSAKPHTDDTLTPSTSTERPTAADDTTLDRSTTREQATHTPKPKKTAETSAIVPDATPSDSTSTGAITIQLKAANGKPFAGDWTLEVEDNELAARHDPNARRTIAEHGPSVAVNARPGVVHALTAYAKGLSSTTQRCQLPPQRPVAEVELNFQPAAAIQGRVVDANGAGARGLDIWLVPGFVSQGNRTNAPPMSRTIVTDATGAFRVESLLPGRWNVLVGPRDNPTARHNDVTVAGTDITLEPITLPQMYSVVVRVKDDQGRVVSAAAVTGRGSVGGAIEGTSDAGGEARFDAVPAGRWRVFANTADGKRGVSLVNVPLTDASVIEVTVRTTPPVGDRR